MTRQLFWQMPLTILACVAGSEVAVWAISRTIGFTMAPSLVAVLSAVTSGAAIAIALRGKRKTDHSSVD